MALDQITKALLAEYLEGAEIRSQGEPSDFEKFTTHILVSPQIDGPIDYQNVLTGAGGDTGLDAIAMLVNGELITDPDAVDLLSTSGATLNVNYIFIQAETKDKFATAKIDTITAGVEDFFSSSPTIVRNDLIDNLAQISNQIIRNARLFRDGNPSCTVYYVTAGKWAGDPNLVAKIDKARNRIERLRLFSEVQFIPIDAQELQKRYQAVRIGVEKEFTFQNRVTLPEISHVTESHLGYIGVLDFLELLKDADGKLSPSLFYDNVRDFQGKDNSVNGEIAATLSGADKALFPLMNNGVTVIAKSVRQTGTRFVIKDFQVVNGCQTCNVLWLNRSELDNEVLVPLRLISTADESVITNIIRATNRQTEVKAEQLHATSDYLKQIELYFESTPESRRLYMERRSKQYANSTVERTRIVPFNHLIRSFASVVLQEPHRATRNYKQILERIPTEILNPDHKPSIYLAAASALYRLEFLFRNNVLDRRFSSAKYHLLLASSLSLNPELPSQLNGRPAEAWAEQLIDVYWDAAESEALFQRVAADIELIAGQDLSRDKIRTAVFTDALIQHYVRNRS